MSTPHVTVQTQLRVAAGGAVNRSGGRRAWERRASLCDLAMLADGLVTDEAKPVRDLARTLASEARRAAMSRARWLAVLAQALALELAGMLEPGPGIAAPPRPVAGAFVLGGHFCPVAGCRQPVPSQGLMCRPHWFRVPLQLRRRIARAYRPGKAPSDEWVDATRTAIETVAPRRLTARRPS